MADPESAILRTLMYADIFDYPLTVAEIHHYLIAAAMGAGGVAELLERSKYLADRTMRVNGYVTLRGRQDIAAMRDARRDSSRHLWQQARRWAGRLGCLPFVRMVAVTGALAVDNAPAGDDIDLLIVTRPGRVWLARALAIALVRAARLLGVGLCPNYVLADSAMSQHERNLYVAHDLAQMVPLVGLPVYRRMRAVNAWSFAYLPHAAAPPRAETDLCPRGWRLSLQRLGEKLLGGRLGDRLERWERERKLRKFGAAAARSGPAARLDEQQVKGHFDDHGRDIMRQFDDRLARYG
jgi:hypothetical protein